MISRYQWLAGALSEEGVVVTASRRLARELSEVHGELQLASGKKAWATPDIRFVNDWLGELLENGPLEESRPIRIDSQSSTVLWEHCVENSLRESLPGFSGVVRQCKQAWARLQDWCVPLHELVGHSFSTEQKLFATAAQKYAGVLRRSRWIDDAGLAAAVDQLFADSAAMVPSRVCMAGFDRLTPALLKLLSSLEQAGTSVSHAETMPRAETVSLTTYPDAAAELRAAGAWARHQLLEDPGLRLAIVCPNLDSDASRVARHVREGFAPGWQIADSGHSDSVNISFGKPLTEYPAVRVALMLLRWVHVGLDSRDVSILLRTGSIGGGSSATRSRLELKLRRLPDRLWNTRDLLAVLEVSGSRYEDDDWLERIGKIAASRLHYRESASHAEWAERIDSLLAEVGWSDSGTKDSHEFQLLNRWRDLLNEFARLDRVLPSVAFQDAISRLARLAGDAVFQPESENPVLPVLGILEAAGMEFDKIRVTSFDARYWPATGNPLAFVSRQMQKDCAMPDATPQDSLQFSSRVVSRILQSAGEVVFSWAQFDNDVPLQPSPLLEDIEVTAAVGVADPGWYASTLLDSKLLTPASADPVPPTGDNEIISGGAYTVQLQAGDPFSAFAIGRLRVGELSPFQVGLSARIRGNAIHAALSDVYSEHPSRSDLVERSAEDALSRITKAVERSLAYYQQHADPALRRIISLEKRRIEKILLCFAEQELLRDNFRVTLTEEQLEYSGHGIQLALRVDRVDQLDDQSILIIDYKTGAEKSLVNRGDELLDLQLMVYAFALQQELAIGGIAIINLDSRKISMKAAEHDDEWEERYSRWSAVADNAIQGIARGDARVNLQQNSDQARSLNLLSRFEELRRDR